LYVKSKAHYITAIPRVDGFDQPRLELRGLRCFFGGRILSCLSSATHPTIVNITLGFKMPVISRLALAVQLFAVIFSPALAASVAKEYDYVIVGGGITGLVVANRLSEDKSSEYIDL
jgi:hypothetical protein